MTKRTIFWGTPDFSLPSLAAAFEGSDLVAVVTQPDKPKGRGHEVLPTPVKAWATQKKIKVFSPKSVRKLDAEGEELMNFLRANPVDYFVVVAYGNILPQAVLDLPRLAPVNVHASLLPRWRGAAPIQRSLEAGDLITGVSLQRMVAQLDAGDVLLEKKYSVTPSDNAKTLFEKLSVLGGELVSEFLRADFSQLRPAPQDATKVSLAAKISKEEAIWSPAWTTDVLCNRVRAFLLWPVVKVIFAKGSERIEVKILEAKLLKSNPSAGWGVHAGAAYLTCANGPVEIVRAQIPGKGPVPGAQAFEKLLHDGFAVS